MQLKYIKLLVSGLSLSGCLPVEAVYADVTCSPKIVGAKVLASENTQDTHSEWIGSQIGLSWSLMKVIPQGEFMSGTLVTPRGGQMKYKVYVLNSEWKCR